MVCRPLILIHCLSRRLQTWQKGLQYFEGKVNSCLFDDYLNIQKSHENLYVFQMNTESDNSIDARDSDSKALQIETLYVHDVYEEIAHHFSSTRHKPWPKVAQFVASLPQSSLLLDIGCGNGKYFGLNPDIFSLGCDRSINLTSICGQKGMEVFTSDVQVLPVRSATFDACLCIAVIHHFASTSRRTGVIAEIARVLRPGGQALIYVWAMEQEGVEKETSNYIKEARELKYKELHYNEEVLPVHINRTGFKQQDLLVPWHLKKAKEAQGHESQNVRIFHRYYHVFCKGELEILCRSVPDLTLVQQYYDKGNWCVIVQKKS